MNSWTLEFSPDAEIDLAKLDQLIRQRVIDKIDWLYANFDSLIPLALHYEFRDFYKLRVGDWRVFYKINWQENKIKISYIDHRGKSYKKRKK